MLTVYSERLDSVFTRSTVVGTFATFPHDKDLHEENGGERR